MMARSWVEQNPPLEVEFLGFRTTSATLGRCGWKMALDLHGFRATTSVMFHHPDLGLTLIGTGSDDLRRRAIEGAYARPMLVRVDRCIRQGDRIHRAVMDSPLEDFRWVDTSPSHYRITDEEFHSLPLFRELDKPVAQELIVDPADVGRILELVHRAQAPEQAEIRERNRKREARVQMHAHILSLAA